MSRKTLIIAEAGVNHNGDEHLALRLVREAHQAGADIVKFQTFKAANIVTNEAAQANYQMNNIVAKVSDNTVMFDDCSSINHNILPNIRPRIYNSSW